LSQQLANSLLTGLGLSHPCADPDLIETHISWLVLLGDYVYKIKKPLNLGFVDATSLAQRKHFCEEELRLNSRTAPDVYLEVVAICGSEEQPLLYSSGTETSEAFEYAVKMKRFPQSAILRNMAEKGLLDKSIIHQLGTTITVFHASLSTAPHEYYGTPEQVHSPVIENFASLKDELNGDRNETLQQLENWSIKEYQRIHDDLLQRHKAGFVRECHGDLHLGNLLFLNDKCQAFDCVEFSPDLLWIDTASDIAFTIMDLETHHLHDLAHQFLNEYLEMTGDYSLLSILPYYLVYRAMVRAKIAAIRASQSDLDFSECHHYLDRALQYSAKASRAMVLMCGLSGSGKTTVANELANTTSFIRIRSDVERKRLFGIGLLDSSDSSEVDIYSAASNKGTLEALLKLASSILEFGYGVVIDSTMTSREWRDAFTALAADICVKWVIVYCKTDDETARKRLNLRSQDASEATFNQYLVQKKAFDPFTMTEKMNLVTLTSQDKEPVHQAALDLAELFSGQQIR
jgi:aminoglycoside phosphotransferase family enzyme/gluconate kinase